MKPVPSANAVQPARVTPAGSCAPKARPTRTVTAWPNPNGTMKQKAAICSAMACAASSSAPIRPMSSAAALKIVTSKASVRPIGTPIRQSLR